MPELTGYELGTHNAQCDECGRGFKFYSLRKRWDNAYTCSACWEIRQPQDFVRAMRDDQSVPVARPRLFVFVQPAAAASMTPLGDSYLGQRPLGG